MKSKKKFRVGRIVKWLLIPILTIAIIGLTFGALLFASYASTAPKLDMAKLESQPNTVILDKNGNTIAQLGVEKRVNINTNQIPMTMVNAITSIEDHRFFDHRGIDPIRILGSVIHNVRNNTTQGGSTLTQELIKLSFFSTSVADQNLRRKAQEAWMSIELEKKLSKEEILTLYLNKVYMSNGYYGVQTAAENFYGKPLSQLTLPQVALLAGIPQAPNEYDPYNPNTQAAAKLRRDTVLRAMYQYGKISQADETVALNTPVTDGLQPLPTSSSIPAKYNNFITEVLLQVKNDTGKDPSTTSMKIYTTMDSSAQDHLFDVFNTGDYVNYPDGQQVAATIVEPNTGAVIAQLGGRNQPTDSVLGDNPAVNTDRDWGSTMKPLTDYAPALDNGVYKSTAQTFDDTPYNYPGSTTPVHDWDNRYMGTITMRYALWQSRNIPALKALVAVGLDNSSAFLGKLGIKYSPSEVYSNAFSSNTSTLGREWGTSSEKQAAAYAAFANGGNYTKPYYVSKIVYSDGVSKNLTPSTSRVMKETTAYMITDMLKGVITSGTNGPTFAPSRLIGLYQAGKTGTSNYDDNQLSQLKATSAMEVPDETFVGYTQDYSIAVWTGYTDRLYPVQDIQVSAEVYTAMMQYFYPSTSKSVDWTMPSGLNRYGSELYLDGATPSANSSSGTKTSSSASTSSSATSESSNTLSSSSSSDSTTTPSSSSDTTTSSSTGN
ncbi:MAG: transglycosylase domain-containing protein [Streptococcaceae bacterium]|nr:transglycosylase domain-containing protein [Streptococcaceae bacterium]